MQRTRIGDLLGQVRDLEADWTKEAIQRITTENTTLKQRVRQLTTDNRTLDERLKAARSNMRFQDRRLADLEAQLADPSAGPDRTMHADGPGHHPAARAIGYSSEPARPDPAIPAKSPDPHREHVSYVSAQVRGHLRLPRSVKWMTFISSTRAAKTAWTSATI